jgi:hypothetical protein
MLLSLGAILVQRPAHIAKRRLPYIKSGAIVERRVCHCGPAVCSQGGETIPVHRLVASALMAAGGVMAAAALLGAAPSEVPWHESFEGPNPSWRPAGSDVEYRLEIQGRYRGGAHTGQSSEQLRVIAGNGSYVFFAHPVPPSRVTSQLVPSVWIKADRTGLQILARIVLPNLIDPRTRQPVTVNIRGTSYSQVGIWEQLRIEDVPRELQHQVWALNRQYGREVDTRGAYLDQVWLNIYGGAGTTNLAIDDLEVKGIVEPTPPAGEAKVETQASDASSPANRDPIADAPHGEPNGPRVFWAAAGSAPTPAREVRLDGSVLLVNGHAFFPRILRYHGEPLDLVLKSGFNAIRLLQPPPPELLADANRLGLWLICPPPAPPAANTIGGQPPPLPPAYDIVLAWHLGDDLTAQELPSITETVRWVRAADLRRRRPIVCGPQTELRAYSRQVDVLSFGRAPLGTSVELADYMVWLRERPRLARPGTSFWTTVQTQISPAAQQQASVFSGPRPPIVADGESIRLLTYTALSAGARGTEFELDAPLDKVPRSLQLQLALLNMELELAEPWAASGSYVDTADSYDNLIHGAVLQAQGTRLLLPMRVAKGSQFIPQYLPSFAAKTAEAITVAGVPEDNRVYELTPAGLTLLKHQKVTGGTQISFDEFQLSSMVLITSDAAAVDSLSRRLSQMADRAAPLERELVAEMLAEIEAVDARLPRRTESALPADWLAKGRAALSAADKALAAGDRAAAYQASRKAIGPLEQYKRYRWNQVVTTQNSLVTSPFTVAFETLPDQWKLQDRLQFLQPGNNRLVGGDCENSAWMLSQGWRRVDLRQSGVRALVESSSTNPHGGKASLHLQVKPANPEEPPSLIETAPVWVMTPPIRVSASELIAIRGFVRVPPAITGSIDGLMILDSIGGESMAERISKTDGWREFIMYRVAPSAGPFTVTFALSGLGDAWIDDVSIAPVTRLAGNELGRAPAPWGPANGSPVRR